MKVLRFTEREGWLNGRLGSITGSKWADIRTSKERKVGSYRLIVESILGSAALAEEDQMTPIQAMERGSTLEKESVARFVEETGIKAKHCPDDMIWVSDVDSRIRYSPDAVIGNTMTKVVESKSLSAANHIKAKITGRIPAEYRPQAVHAFVVNEKLRTLYFCFYDPRWPKGLDFFYIELDRKDIKDEIEEALAFQLGELKWVRDTVNALTLYSPEEIAKAEQVREELLDDSKSALERVYAGIKERSLS